MTKVRISVKVDRLLRETLFHIAQDNPTAAVNLIAELRQRVVGTLSVFPEAGTKWGERKRFLTIRRYTFVYGFDPAKDEVMVLDVFGPGMDWR
ncbi:MAG: type II toxin-antitoxin system RelE/ParE family toxin [Gemmobacter sp.]